MQSTNEREQRGVNAIASLAPVVTGGSSRSKINVGFLDNSHSNKKMPTWKGSLIEGSRLSQIDQQNKLKDVSLDRVNSKKLLANALANNSVVQSRHELLQNNYKKVIQNHPSTIGTGKD